MLYLESEDFHPSATSHPASTFCFTWSLVETLLYFPQVVEVAVPRGCREGDRIPLAGKGDEAESGRPGDVLLVVHEAVHKLFQRQGNDLVTTVQIPCAQVIFFRVCGIF